MLKLTPGVVMVSLLLAFTPCSSVSVVNFKHVIANWGMAGHFFQATHGVQVFYPFQGNIAFLYPLKTS